MTVATAIADPVTIAETVDQLSLPRTPAEAKRHWMIDRMWAGSLFSFVALLFLVLIVWLGRWPDALSQRRLDLLGGLGGLLLARLIIVDLAFSLGGPVGRWEARWGNRSITATDDARTVVERAYDGARP